MDTHVSTKANRTLGFLRYSQSHVPKMLRKWHIRDCAKILEYASSVWDTHGIVVQEDTNTNLLFANQSAHKSRVIKQCNLVQ